jgi:hypothetical protein
MASLAMTPILPGVLCQGLRQVLYMLLRQGHEDSRRELFWRLWVFLVKVCDGLLCMFKILDAFPRVATRSVALPSDQVEDPTQIMPVVLGVEDFLHLKL